MDLVKIIHDLRRERSAIEEALVFLEKLAATNSTRRGRPPTLPSGEPARKRKPFSEATKKKMAAAQKQRWAAARAAKGSDE